MIKLKVAICVAICISPIIYGQSGKPIPYKDYITSELTIRKNLYYASNIPGETRKKYYRFDIYYAAKDSSTKRPLIIWMHGGGFKFGSKKAKGIRLWSKSFARRGYVCVAINYRLSKKNPLRNFTSLVQGCYEAVQDVTQAITFFKANEASFGIDTNLIILAGNSAGAIIALQTVYSSYSDLTKLIDSGYESPPATDHNSSNIKAVINFWGAIFNTAWLKNANVPIVSVHGKKDRIVPYDHKGSPLYGSFAIHQKADSLKIPNRVKTYDRYGHELQKHFIPILRSAATKRRWLTAGSFAADFLYNELMQ
ncbi:MAG: alpha/beta hydrolase [Chitinophagaceae bacterium]|nr:alpha/beta hydrolase [Chitinophagaceae bacterium]